MDSGSFGVPSLGGLESSLPLSEPPCLIVEDSQPDSIGLEDDPENSYKALLTKRLTTLQPREHSPELELISSPVGSRSQNSSQSQPPIPEMNPCFEDSEILDVSEKRSHSTDSRGESQGPTHEEGTSQFGFLELSQSQDFGAEPIQDQTRSEPDESSRSIGARTSTKTVLRPGLQSRPSRQVSVDALLHSQNQEEEAMLLSQDDLFDKTGAALSPALPSCTPSRSLALLHLSGGIHGTLVNNSLSQSSVDFVAPTPDNITSIIPSSPTELPPHAAEPMNTSLPPANQSKCRDPSPASSTTLSQNTPGFELERPLSVPSQPEFSHDVFAPTQSQPSCSSQNLGSPAATINTSTAFSESSLNLCINTEQEGDNEDEDTQIEDETNLQNSATNSQNIQASPESQNRPNSQAATNQAETLHSPSHNNLQMSSQAASKRLEMPKQAPNSTSHSQEYLKLNVNGKKSSQGSAKHNSQPTGSVTGLIVNKEAILALSQEKIMGQAPGSVQDAKAASQSKILNVDHEKDARNLSQESAKANSLPTGSATSMSVNKEADLGASQVKITSQENAKASNQPDRSVQKAVGGAQSNFLNVDKNARTLSQENGKANSQPIGSVSGMMVNEEAVFGNSQAKTMSQGRANANGQSAGSAAEKIVEHKAIFVASHGKIKNVDHKKMNEETPFSHSQPSGSATGMIVNEVFGGSQGKLPNQGNANANSQQTQSIEEEVMSQSKTVTINHEVSLQNLSGGGRLSGTEREESLGLVLSQSLASSPGKRGDKLAADGREKVEVSEVKSLDSSGDISFHFTLPKEGELIGPAVIATPPQIIQMKQSLRHSTPIELNSLSQNSNVSATSNITVEGRDNEAEGADAANGKLSLRMKLVTPVEECSSESFSLQRPPLTEDDPTGFKSTANSTHSRSSVFSRVRQVHRPEQDDPSLHRGPLFSSPQRSSLDCNSLPNSQSDASMQESHSSIANDCRERNPSHHAPGVANSHDKIDAETPPPSRAGPSHHRHVRTIQEVRTTITRIITEVYYEDGKEVDRTVTQESDEPVVQIQVMDVSPSRTGSSSLTSGDLADISSSTGTTGTTSNSVPGTSSTDRPEFVQPTSRGAKTSRAPPAGMVQDSVIPVPVLDTVSDSSGSSPGPRSRSGSSFVGLRVVAKWSSNGYFYSGRIIEDRGLQGGSSDSGSGPGENSFRLRFDDGYECELLARDILLCDPIPLETEVTALNEDQTYTTGVVTAHKMEGSELQYCVDRGELRVWFSRGSVILSLDQGNKLREHYSLGPYHPPTPLGKASDISLDNLVEGKRKRRAGQSGLTPTRSARVRTKPSSDPSPGPSSGYKRKITSDITTPTKRGRRRAVQQVLTALNTSDSEPPPTACDHAPGTCDASCDLASTHGPCPQNLTLFEGFVFLLTAASERDRLSNRHHYDDDEELVQTGPYNKSYTESQLLHGGGIILKEFNHQQCEAAYQSLLIADQHCRNRTYLLCVASGVPCVSHLWVRDCCRDNSLLNYRNYLLPAGAGPEGGVREWRPRCCPFKSLRVLLLVEDHAQFWSELVQLGGGTVLTRSPKDQSEFPAADVLVADPDLDPGPVPGLELPRVSVDWLIHSVICGEILDLIGSSFGLDSLSSSSS